MYNFQKYYFPDDCTPTTPTTFLFAYSNDLDANTVQNSWNYIAAGQISPHFSHFASIRFDTTSLEEFLVHENWRDVNTSIQSHLPTPSLGFQTDSMGSDVLKMIDRFLDSAQFPVCGSKLLILVRRNPNEKDISKLVSKIRSRHCTITIQASTSSIGGDNPEILYDLATFTNGFCAFDKDEGMVKALVYLPLCFNPYMIYAANPLVSGNGSLVLATLNIPARGIYWTTMTIQNSGPLDAVQNVVLTGTGTNLKTLELGVTGASSWGTWYGNHVGGWELLDQGVYNMTLDFVYLDSAERRIQIRIFDTDADGLDHWASFDN
ncbi:unnamed protein product [Caenorhabditis brenneri]